MNLVDAFVMKIVSSHMTIVPLTQLQTRLIHLKKDIWMSLVKNINTAKLKSLTKHIASLEKKNMIKIIALMH